MKPKSLIILLVIIQVSVIVGSFSSLLVIDLEHQNYADYIHISEKNVFYTAMILHELDEYSAGLLGEDEINGLFDEFEENIFLLKNGGVYLINDIEPLPAHYQSEVDEISQLHSEFKNILNTLNGFLENGDDPSDAYYIEHERIEVALIEKSESLTTEINLEFDESIKFKETLEILLTVINVAVYVSTIYVILRTLQKEAQQMKKLQKPKISVIGLGFVGLSLSVVNANYGFQTIGIDIDKKKLEKVKNGDPDFFEPQLDKFLKDALKKKTLSFSGNLSEVLQSDITFITVGTPSTSKGKIDLKNLN